MTNRNPGSKVRRPRRTSYQIDLPSSAESQEAAQQVENFVEVLADLLADRAEASPPPVESGQSGKTERQAKSSQGDDSAMQRSPETDLSPAKPTEPTPAEELPSSSTARSTLKTALETPPQNTTPTVSSPSLEPDFEPDFEPASTSDRISQSPPIPLDAQPVTTPEASGPAIVETTALVLAESPEAPQAGGVSDTPVDAESVGSELNNLRTLLIGLEEQFYDPDKLVRLLLPGITEAIRTRLKQRNSAIANVLRSEMAIPIDEQIAVERDALIDALYPVIGSTLAEYFTETLRTINSRVASNADDVTPRDATPASDEQAMGLRVQALVLVHRATGLVLAQAIATKDLVRTAERQAELLTAIRSAANARMAQPQASGQTGKYRQGHILVELSDACYLAALVQGDPPVSFWRRMGHALEAIVTDHRQVIEAFEGNTDTVPDAITQRLQRLLRIHNGTNPRRRPARLIGIGLLLLGIAASVWGMQALRDRRLATLTAQVERTAALLNQGSGVSITARTSDEQVILEGDVLQFNDVDTIRQAFEQIAGVEAVIDRIETQPLAIPTQIYFYPNSTVISPRDVANKVVTVAEMLNQYPEFNLRIIGHHNPADESDTESLGLNRALAVADALADQGIARQRLDATEAQGPPPGVNTDYQPWLGRAVLFEIVVPAPQDPPAANNAAETPEEN